MICLHLALWNSAQWFPTYLASCHDNLAECKRQAEDPVTFVCRGDLNEASRALHEWSGGNGVGALGTAPYIHCILH